MRELKLNRILCSFLSLCNYKIHQNPSWDILQEGDDLYEGALKEARFDNSLYESEVSALCVQKGLLQPNFEKKIQLGFRQLETFQLKLYVERDNPQAVKSARSKINGIRNGILEVNRILHNYKVKTVESYAEEVRNNFVFKNCIYNKDYSFLGGEGFAPRQLEKLYFEYLKKMPSDDEIRELARSEPWRTMWAVKKGANFTEHPMNMYQVALSRYSKFYDNIFKHPEAPSARVIEDDDMLDGWVIAQSKKNSSDVSSAVSKHKEVFVMAKNEDEAQEIYLSNSPDARRKMNQRQRQIDQGKVVQHAQLNDFKMEQMNKHER